MALGTRAFHRATQSRSISIPPRVSPYVYPVVSAQGSFARVPGLRGKDANRMACARYSAADDEIDDNLGLDEDDDTFDFDADLGGDEFGDDLDDDLGDEFGDELDFEAMSPAELGRAIFGAAQVATSAAKSAKKSAAKAADPLAFLANVFQPKGAGGPAEKGLLMANRLLNPQQARPPAPPAPVVVHNPGLSTGAAVGLGLGALALGGVAAWFLLRPPTR